MSNYLNFGAGLDATASRVNIISLHADPATPPGAAGAGGTHSYLRELLTALPRRGQGVNVITRRTSAALPAHQQISRSADVFRVQIGELAPLDKRLLDGMHQRSIAAVAEVLAANPLPVRLLHSVYWNSGRVALDLSRNLGIPFVHTVISNGKRRVCAGADENAIRREQVEHDVFEGAFRIFCICASERDDLVNLYGIDAAKILIVGRPVSIELLVPPHDECGQPLLLPPWNESDLTSASVDGIGAE